MNDWNDYRIAHRRLEMAMDSGGDDEAIRACLEDWPVDGVGSPLSVFLGSPLETQKLIERGCRVSTGDVDIFFNWFHLSIPVAALVANGQAVWALWSPQINESPQLREHCLRRWTRDTENVQFCWNALKMAELLSAHRMSPLWEVPSQELDALEKIPSTVLRLNATQLAWAAGNFKACQVLLEHGDDQAWANTPASSWPAWDLEQALTLGSGWLKGLRGEERKSASEILAYLKEEDVTSLDSCRSLKSWLLAQRLERTLDTTSSQRSGLRL